MGVSRFSDDYDWEDRDTILAQGRWLARMNKVLKGRPGRKALRQLERALVMMPHKRLTTGGLCDGNNVCVVGAWLYRKYVDDGMTPKAAWWKLQERKPFVYSDGSIGRGYSDFAGYEELQRTVEMGKEELGVTRTLLEVLAFINDEEEGYSFQYNGIDPEVLYSRLLTWVREHMATDAEVAA